MVAVNQGKVGDARKHPGPSCIDDGFQANLAVFNGTGEAICTAISTAAFAFMGIETVAITAYEAKNRKQLNMPVRYIAWLISGLYMISVFGAVINVSWYDNRLPTLYENQEGNPAASSPLSACITAMTLAPRATPATSPSTSSSTSATIDDASRNLSPLVIALQNVDSSVGQSAITGCLIYVVLSAANAGLYVASRTLFGLTRKIDRNASFPMSAVRRLGWVTKGTEVRGYGVIFGKIPAPSIFFSVLCFCWIPFIHLSKHDSIAEVSA